jgi:hypothetical protein
MGLVVKETTYMSRGLVVVIGILVGLGVYSYGMFHTFLPSWSNIADVANCGVPPGAAYQAVDTKLPGAGGLPLCQVAPGEWVKTPYGDGPLFLALVIAFGCTMAAIHRSTFLKVATRSAKGTVFLFLLIFGIPMLLLGFHLNYVEGTLTLDWAIHVAMYSLLGAAAFGTFAWYTFVRGLRREVSARTSAGTSVEHVGSMRSEMAESPSFQFRVTYDRASVQATGRTLFKHYWISRRVGTIGALIVLLLSTSVCLYYNAKGALWIVGSLAVLNILIWPFQRWAIGHRAKRSLGSSASVKFTSADFSIGSGAGSYRQPWSHFVFTQVDEANLYLFLSAINAITIPRKDVTVEAIEFARNHVRADQFPLNRRWESQ